MKRKSLLILAACLVLIAGCGNSNIETSVNENTEEAAVSEIESQADPAVEEDTEADPALTNIDTEAIYAASAFSFESYEQEDSAYVENVLYNNPLAGEEVRTEKVAAMTSKIYGYPSEDSALMATYIYGDKMPVIGATADGQWYMVEYGNHICYVKPECFNETRAELTGTAVSSSAVTSENATVSIQFGSSGYNYTAGEEFLVRLYFTASEQIGTYHIELAYDSSRMKLVRGADADTGSALILEGTATGNTVTYWMAFDALSGGTAGMYVSSALISNADGSALMEVTNYPSAPIYLSGTNTQGDSFSLNPGNGQISANSLADEFLGVMNENSDTGDQLRDPDGNVIPTCGKVTFEDGSQSELVDLAHYIPKAVDWDYMLVSVDLTEDGERIDCLTDQENQEYFLYTVDDQGNFDLYALDAGQGLLWPVMETESFYYMAPTLLASEELTEDGSDDFITILGKDGNVSAYQLSQNAANDGYTVNGEVIEPVTDFEGEDALTAANEAGEDAPETQENPDAEDSPGMEDTSDAEDTPGMEDTSETTEDLQEEVPADSEAVSEKPDKANTDSDSETAISSEAALAEASESVPGQQMSEAESEEVTEESAATESSHNIDLGYIIAGLLILLAASVLFIAVYVIYRDTTRKKKAARKPASDVSESKKTKKNQVKDEVPVHETPQEAPAPEEKASGSTAAFESDFVVTDDSEDTASVQQEIGESVTTYYQQTQTKAQPESSGYTSNWNLDLLEEEDDEQARERVKRIEEMKAHRLKKRKQSSDPEKANPTENLDLIILELDAALSDDK